MAHFTVYLPRDVESRVRKAAKKRKTTVNRWIAEQITIAVNGTLPESFLEAAGAVPDFPSLQQIRSGYGEESTREVL